MDNSEIPRRGKYVRKSSNDSIRITAVSMRIASGKNLPYVREGEEPLCLNEGNSFVSEVPPRKENKPLKVYFSLNWEEFENEFPVPPRPLVHSKLRSALKGSRKNAAEASINRAEAENWFQNGEDSDDEEARTLLTGLRIRVIPPPRPPQSYVAVKACTQNPSRVHTPAIVYKPRNRTSELLP